MTRPRHVALGLVVLGVGGFALVLAAKMLLRLVVGVAVLGAVGWVGYKLTRKAE